MVAATLFLVLASPLLLAIAAAVKLTSRGPIVFRQRRVGRGGRIFWMLKFRTMVHDAEARKAGLRAHNEAEGLFKIVDDPRVTPIGRFLRRSSLDELPQLINVLRGAHEHRRTASARARGGPDDRRLAPPPAARATGHDGDLAGHGLRPRAARARWSSSTTCTS